MGEQERQMRICLFLSYRTRPQQHLHRFGGAHSQTEVLFGIGHAGLFALTPALSPGERGNKSRPLECVLDADLTSQRDCARLTALPRVQCFAMS